SFEARRARGIAAAAIGVRARGANAVERDAHILAFHAAEPRTTRFRLDVIEIDARKVLEELTDVSVGDVAEDVRRNRGHDVHAAALFHDRLRVAFALGGDG